MTISGNLRSLELSELLQWLSQGRKTGTLVVRNRRVEKQVILRNGRIISSASTDPDEHLGEFLVGRGYIDRTTLDHARKLQEATQIFLGKVLVTLDSLSQVDLERVMREKTEESLYDLFLWQDGDFEFLRDQLPNLAMVPLSLDVTQVVMEGLRRLDEHNRAASGPVEDRASVEAREIEKELETVPLADLVASGAAPPAADLGGETLHRTELREEALAELPRALEEGGTPPDPPAAPPSGAAEAAEASRAEVEMPDEETLLAGSGAYAGALTSGSRRAVYLAASAILAAGAIGWGLFALRGPGPGAAAAEQTTVQASEAEGVENGEVEALQVPPPAVDSSSPTMQEVATAGPAAAEAERLAAELEDLVAARRRELESSLKAEYEAKLAGLEEQLAAARRDAEAARRSEAATRPAAVPAGEEGPAAGGGESRDPEAPVAPRPESAPPVLSTAVLASSGAASPAPRFAVQRTATPPEPPPAEAGPPRPETAPPESAGEAGLAGPAGSASPTPDGSEPPAETPAVEAPAAPAKPAVREGDLVERLPGLEPPRLLAQPKPLYPPAAQRARRGGRVDVRVRVDETGRVVEVRQVGDKVGLGFDKAALDAAALTRWQPANLDGVRVSTWVDLRIEFRP